MSRLRNRMLKAEFWTDPELLRWPREKRWTYQGLWEMAEDSGCLEDDPFGWKLLLWPSPLDCDITVELLEQWRDELIEAGKLVPYQADGKSYLWLRNFHQHEHPRNPQSPNLPLPPWVHYRTREVVRKDGGRGSTYTVNEYIIDYALVPGPSKPGISDAKPSASICLAHGSDTVMPELPWENHKETPVPSCPVLSSPDIDTFGAQRGCATEPEPAESPPQDDLAEIDFDQNSESKPPPVAVRAEPKSVREAVAYLVDYAKQSGYVLTRGRIGHWAKQIAEVWEAGVDPPLLRQALELALAENKRPSDLACLVNDLRKGGSNGGRPQSSRARRSDGRSFL